MTMNEIEKELALHDEALFGIWASATHRQHGVVEKTNSILSRLPRLEKMLHGVMALMIVPVLNAVGVPTQSLVPMMLKLALHLLGS